MVHGQSAHAHGETVGGNVFDSAVPADSDAIAFVDDIVAGSQYGFDFDRKEVTALQAALGSTILVGNLQSNPQND